ncbi:hypothetical protein N7495_006633 [Penicillium taxi]|uniref:uncharacterized protein n=1 Tax=Penicillium taxi TaxID=168475 RepID=UPI0025451886|nr:uncharacterized protein N7495_006633 [Penicillium taxi]KAJ5894942.1 hypothetical protein N7495_006633 [Penicillium taxi]
MVSTPLSNWRKKTRRPPPIKIKGSFFKAEEDSSDKPRWLSDGGKASKKEKEKMKLIVPPKSQSKAHEKLGMPSVPNSAFSEVDMGTTPRIPCQRSFLAFADDNSPQGSVPTITYLDSPHDSDDSDISPLSDRPSARSASVLARFFPELTNNISLAPPVGLYEKKMKKTETPSDFRNELERRVNSLYMNSEDAAVGEDGYESSFELQIHNSSEENIFDGASSCYSRRASFMSVDGGYVGGDEAGRCCSADAFSIMSPAAAGVFDDAASVLNSRPLTSRTLSTTRPQSAARPSQNLSRSISTGQIMKSSSAERIPPAIPRHPSRRISFSRPSRSNSLTSRVTIEDWRNKPLPLEPSLEPIIEPNPLSIRQYESQPSLFSPAFQMEEQSMLNPHWRPADHAYHVSAGPAGHRHHQERQAAPSQNSSRTDMRGDGRTMSQAAEELEATLADLEKEGKTVLILDGPLQISRNNGELVATRRAPLPPPMKSPYSRLNSQLSPELPQTPKKSRSSRVDEMKAQQAREEKGHKHTKAKEHSKPKEQSKPKEHSKPKLSKKESKKDLSKVKYSSSHSRQPSDGKEKRKDEQWKLKKSFSLFHRKQSLPRVEEIRMSMLASRSEASLVIEGALKPLSERSNSLPFVSKSDDEAISSPIKNPRERLRKQLPRLQTSNLDLSPPYGSVPSDRQRQTADAELEGNVVPPVPSKKPSLELRATLSEEEKIPVTFDSIHQTHSAIPIPKPSNQIALDPVYELDATPPTPFTFQQVMEPLFSQKFIIANWSENLPDHIIMTLMQNATSLDDLFSLAIVNRQFYRVFKEQEMSLIKSAVFKMSPPAWELREMSPPWDTEVLHRDPDAQVPEYTPTTYLERYAQDIYALAKLKSMMLVRCVPFLRHDTVRGLSGMDYARAEEVDDAFWRIWTFCRIFGSGKGREADLEGQVDWLKGGAKARAFAGAASTMTEPFGMNKVLFEPPKGFGLGNIEGLSPKQLYDMTEIWTCLAVLLQPLHGKCIEARKVGIYDGMDVPEGDANREQTVLEEWTSYILTLGMSAVLVLSSICPAEATLATFETAQAAGLTKWELTDTETTRASFLKEALSLVYEDNVRFASPDTASPHELSSGDSESREQDRERQCAFSLELRTRRLRGSFKPHELDILLADERPMSQFSTVLHNLNGTSSGPVPPVPALILDRASTSTSSTAPRTPKHSATSSQPSNSSTSSLAPAPLRPQIQDPVDRAITRMVTELGFDEEDVKWALKITDTGEGIDVKAAEQLLMEKTKREINPFAPRGKRSLLQFQGSQESGWRWA